jgi:hypothetical protein
MSIDLSRMPINSALPIMTPFQRYIDLGTNLLGWLKRTNSLASLIFLLISRHIKLRDQFSLKGLGRMQPCMRYCIVCGLDLDASLPLACSFSHQPVCHLSRQPVPLVVRSRGGTTPHQHLV